MPRGMENLVTEVTGSAERHPGGTLPLPLAAWQKGRTNEQTNGLVVVAAVSKASLATTIVRAKCNNGSALVSITFYIQGELGSPWHHRQSV